MKKRIDVDITDIAIIAEKHEREEFTFECRSREYDGFVYFMEGEGTLYISGTTFSLPVFPGALFWFHRGDSYRFRVEAGCHYVTSAYRLVRDDASIVPLLPTMTMAEGAGELAIEQLVREWESRRPTSYMRCRLAILAMYLEHFVTSPAWAEDAALVAAVDFIHKNFRRAFRSEELAAACSLSPSHLRGKFREAMGMSVTAYRDRLRLAAACEMLESGLFAPKDVAYELGYADVYHFTKIFTARMGVSPARYAKKKK